ncbi:MAG: ATP-binding cassette domain-containing protein [Alphaproteobacteria bacterium]|nr:ATP-binding cassette domain-containing protein [Alphaproteobacteria bacterium]
MSTNLKIKIRGLSKRFGPKCVLNNIDLDIQQGKSLVILGGSGSGKSVLIKCILGIIENDKGDIYLDAEKINYGDAKSRDRIISKSGMLFQGGALFDSLSIWENIAFGLFQRQKISRDDARLQALECLKEVGLGPEIADLYPSELSGGMQKRVSLARAIATKPEIIFFDEPTTGLDPIMSDVINNLIIQSVKRLGATAITITHDLGSLYKIADNVAFLREGKIDWYGPLSSLQTSPNQHLQRFIKGQSIDEVEPIKVVSA